MDLVIRNAADLAALTALSEPDLLYDQSGRLLGRFVPAGWVPPDEPMVVAPTGQPDGR